MMLSLTIWLTFCAFNYATAQQPPYPAYDFPNGQPPYSPCNPPQPCPNQQNCGGCATGVNPLENFNGGSNLCGATICQPGQYCIAGRCVATPGNTIGLNVNPFQQNPLCQFNTDCPAGFTCQGGQCAPGPPGGLLGGLGGGPINEVLGQQACSETQPCFAGQVCVGGVCVPSGTANTGNIGYVETTTCLSNDFCKVNERCQAGYCVNNQQLTPFGGPNAAQPCSAYQPCLNGQTCLGGRCLLANPNTAFLGITPCGGQSACPFGQCQDGLCAPGNQLPPIAFACTRGVCPNGMLCQNEQCLPGSLANG